MLHFFKCPRICRPSANWTAEDQVMQGRKMFSSMTRGILTSAAAVVCVAGVSSSVKAATVAANANTTIVSFTAFTTTATAVNSNDGGGRTYNFIPVASGSQAGAAAGGVGTAPPVIVPQNGPFNLTNTTGGSTAQTLAVSNPLTPGSVSTANTQFTVAGVTTTVPYTAGFNTGNTNNSSGGIVATPGSTLDSLGYTAAAQNNFGYGNTPLFSGSAFNSVPQVLLTFGGLDPTKTYNFDLTATRSFSVTGTDTRISDYTISGGSGGTATTTYSLDVANNTTRAVQATGFAPTAAGVITILAQTDAATLNTNKFYYVGVVQIDTVVPEPTSLAGISVLGLAALRRRRA